MVFKGLCFTSCLQGHASGSMDTEVKRLSASQQKHLMFPNNWGLVGVSQRCWDTASAGANCIPLLFSPHDVYLSIKAFKRQESSCHNQKWPITHTSKSSQAWDDMKALKSMKEECSSAKNPIFFRLSNYMWGASASLVSIYCSTSDGICCISVNKFNIYFLTVEWN